MLAELQRAFLSVVRREAPDTLAQDLFASDGKLNARARMEIYAGAFFARQIGAVVEFYPRSAELLGPAFLPLVRRYVLECPGSASALETMTYGFPEFLEKQQHEALGGSERELLAELSQLERARNRVLLGPPSPGALCVERLVRLGADTKLELGSGVELVKVARNALELFDPAIRAERANAHLLFSRPGFRVQYRVLGGAEAAAVERLLQGCSLTEFCQAFLGEPEPAAQAHRAISSLVAERALLEHPGFVRER